MNQETKALYDRLRDLPDFKGELSCDGDRIVLRFHDDLCIEALFDGGIGYIGIYQQSYHYHPEPEDMYNELCEIIKGNVVFYATRKSWGGFEHSGCSSKEYFLKHRWWLMLRFRTRFISSEGIIKR